jgi:hypothetical protein
MACEMAGLVVGGGWVSVRWRAGVMGGGAGAGRGGSGDNGVCAR